MTTTPIALLYDIHGNLPALEAVLAEAESAGSTRYVLGGDHASMGPWPRETAELLEGLRAELDGMLVCHGSPLSDIESVAAQVQAGEERMLDGEAERTIVFATAICSSGGQDRTGRSS